MLRRELSNFILVRAPYIAADVHELRKSLSSDPTMIQFSTRGLLPEFRCAFACGFDIYKINRDVDFKNQLP